MTTGSGMDARLHRCLRVFHLPTGERQVACDLVYPDGMRYIPGIRSKATVQILPVTDSSRRTTPENAENCTYMNLHVDHVEIDVGAMDACLQGTAFVPARDPARYGVSMDLTQGAKKGVTTRDGQRFYHTWPYVVARTQSADDPRIALEMHGNLLISHEDQYMCEYVTGEPRRVQTYVQWHKACPTITEPEPGVWGTDDALNSAVTDNQALTDAWEAYYNVDEDVHTLVESMHRTGVYLHLDEVTASKCVQIEAMGHADLCVLYAQVSRDSNQREAVVRTCADVKAVMTLQSTRPQRLQRAVEALATYGAMHPTPHPAGLTWPLPHEHLNVSVQGSVSPNRRKQLEKQCRVHRACTSQRRNGTGYMSDADNLRHVVFERAGSCPSVVLSRQPWCTKQTIDASYETDTHEHTREVDLLYAAR
jgi:hypothetical protein